MALSLLADAGVAGWLLLILLGASVLAVVIGVVFLIDYVLRPHGEHVARAGLDVLTSPAPSPARATSMQLDDDLEAWEAHWQHQFRATHSALEVFAAADQAGGWSSGSMTNGSGGDGSWAMGPPPDGHGPEVFSQTTIWPVPTQDVRGELHAPGGSRSRGQRTTGEAVREGDQDRNLGAAWLAPELAHDEYAGPVPGVSPAPADRAGPVPWQHELSKMDADTLRWLADYTDRWKEAAAEFTRRLAA